MGTQINVEGAGRKDLITFFPESLIIDGLDNDLPVSPLQRSRIEVGVDPEMVQSILNEGCHTPIVAEQRAKGTAGEMDGQYAVVDGMQRVVNTREANKIRKKTGQPPLMVMAVIRHGLDPIDRYAIMLSANILRTGSDDAVYAEMAHWLINVNNYPVDKVARSMRRTPQTIQAWLADHGFIPEVKEALKEKVIEKTAARELSKHAPEKQVAILAKAREKANHKNGVKRKGKVSVKDIKVAARKEGFEAPSDRRVKAVLGRRIPGEAVEAINWLKGWGPEPPWAADLAAG